MEQVLVFLKGMETYQIIIALVIGIPLVALAIKIFDFAFSIFLKSIGYLIGATITGIILYSIYTAVINGGM